MTLRLNSEVFKNMEDKMKKIISIVLVLMMLTGVFAETKDLLVSSELPFELEQNGDEFTIILEGNPTTGYEWTWTINDKNHVELLDETYDSASSLIGAGGKYSFKFKVLSEGVSTIDFEYGRSFDKQADDKKISVLVYKNGEKVFIEEDQIITIDDPKPVVISSVETAMYYGEEKIELDTKPQEIEGVYMLPVAETLRALGYEVTWNSSLKSIEISKGAQWTAIRVGENVYSKNKMAPEALSSAPVIVNDRTMVPAEFFTKILNIGLTIEKNTIVLNDYEMAIYKGYVKEIVTNEKNVTSYHIVFESTNDMADVIVHTTADETFIQGDIKVGDEVTAITSMMTTMSIPPQTSGYIIY